MAKRGERGKAYFMISAVSQKYDIHPQTLRLYEREGLLKPSRTDGNTRLYSEEDLEQLETILTLTRDLGVNLAGVEIILNLRRKIELMQTEVNQFMDYVTLAAAGGDGRGRRRQAETKNEQLSQGQLDDSGSCPQTRDETLASAETCACSAGNVRATQLFEQSERSVQLAEMFCHPTVQIRFMLTCSSARDPSYHDA